MKRSMCYCVCKHMASDRVWGHALFSPNPGNIHNLILDQLEVITVSDAFSHLLYLQKYSTLCTVFHSML